MSFFRKVLLCTFASILLALLVFLYAPLNSTVLKTTTALLAGGIVSYLGFRIIFIPFNNFLDQLNALTEVARGGLHGERMEIFRTPQLSKTSRRMNDMMEETARRMESLRQDRDQLVSILDEFSDGVLAVDEDNRVLYLNDEARGLLEVRADDPHEKLVAEITRVEVAQNTLEDCLEVGEPIHREGQRISPDEQVILTVNASPLRNESGEVVGSVAAIHDVTELRRLQTVRQDFVANVSHELKTPITAIQGLIETLAGDGDMETNTREKFIKKIRNQTQRMSRMVQDLLTISRLESEDHAIDHQSFDLLKPVEEAVETVQPNVEQKRHELTVNVPESSPRVEGDPAAVRQLVSNLLDNAIKYTDEGGKIELTIRTNEDDVMIEVSDNGAGIEPRKQDRIFERFYRVDDARTREAGGTGLGLSIVKHLTLSLDGEIDVESTPGRGSTFTVTIPRVKGRES